MRGWNSWQDANPFPAGSAATPAGLPLLCIKAARGYATGDIRSRIDDTLLPPETEHPE